MKVSSSIKWSIAVTAMILAAGIWMVLRNQSRLDELKQEPSIRNETAEAPAEASPSKTEPREERETKPKAPKVEISMVAAVAAESIASRAEGRMKTAEERQHQSDLDARITALDPSQLEEFVTEVAADAQLPPDEKRWWISKGIQQLARTDIDKAFALLGSESMAVMKGSGMAASTVTMILNQMAINDPDKAFRQLDSLAAKLPGLNMQQVNSQLLQTVARNNTDKALQLMESRIEPFGTEAVISCLQPISMNSRTDDQSLSLLTYVNSYFTRMKDPESRERIQNSLLVSIGSKLAQKGYDNTLQWMERAKLGREQYLAIGNCAARNSRGPEIGKWLEWVSRETPYQSVPEEKRSDWCQNVRNIALDWVSSDTTAFGSWLETQKPGEVKNMCIVEFAHAIAQDHPETAAEWVKQITYEDDRKFMFKEIYRKGDFKDAGEREAFAKKYGVE